MNRLALGRGAKNHVQGCDITKNSHVKCYRWEEELNVTVEKRIKPQGSAGEQQWNHEDSHVKCAA